MADDYEVGYRKPPRHTRFRQGRSGNPNGRPKGAKNLKTDLLEELAEPIAVRDRGRPTRITKQRALVKSLVARAVQGKDAASGQLLTLILRVLGPDAETATTESALTPEEQEIVRAAIARIARSAEPSDEE